MGLDMKFLRKKAAKKNGVPFFEKEFWPPAYISFSEKEYCGCKVLTELYDARIGDIVTVLQDERLSHRYRLLADSVAGGDDHIVSPREFDIEYHSTVKRED